MVDGITRDPVGISNLADCSFQEMIEKYPKSSGARLAAKMIADIFSSNTNGDLTKSIEKCNDAVRLLNKQYILKCDYLQNDYFGAVLSCIHIENDILNYAFICDCGIIVYDKFGEVKFKTEDEKELYSDPYINKIGISWNEATCRVIVRRDQKVFKMESVFRMAQ